MSVEEESTEPNYDYACKYYGSESDSINPTSDGCSMPNATSVRSMFHYCKQITTIDGTNWSLANVKNAYCMFFKAEKLSSIDGSNGWVLSNCIKTGNMFHGCIVLTAIDLSNLGLGACESTHGMFQGCTALKNVVGMERWNLGVCKTCANMFYGCKALGSDNSNAPNFNFTIGESCENMVNMFAQCESLTSINGTNWNLSGLKNAHNMFGECTSLTSRLITIPW